MQVWYRIILKLSSGSFFFPSHFLWSECFLFHIIFYIVKKWISRWCDYTSYFITLIDVTRPSGSSNVHLCPCSTDQACDEWWPRNNYVAQSSLNKPRIPRGRRSVAQKSATHWIYANEELHSTGAVKVKLNIQTELWQRIQNNRFLTATLSKAYCHSII